MMSTSENTKSIPDAVETAIKTLAKPTGSSLRAIKKFIAEHYGADMDICGPFINEYVKDAVSRGILIQTSGSGARGSFQLAGVAIEPAISETFTNNPGASSVGGVPQSTDYFNPHSAAFYNNQKSAYAGAGMLKMQQMQQAHGIQQMQQVQIGTLATGGQKMTKKTIIKKTWGANGLQYTTRKVTTTVAPMKMPKRRTEHTLFL